MRGLAALYVMFTHLAQSASQGLGPRMHWLAILPFHFGQEAVMLFFLISGFVIFYSTERQQPDFVTYLSRRWRRIYPVFLLSLALGALGLVILKSRPFPWRDFWGNFFMLQDSGEKPGCWFPAFGGNAPLWSLAYEWWFYVLFYPIWRFAPATRQQIIAAFISLVGLIGYAWHPNQPCLFLAYFIVWWTGGEFARQYVAEGRVTFQSQRTTIGIMIGFVGLAVVLLSLSAHHYYNWSPFGAGTRSHLSFRVYPIIQMRQFAAGLMIAIGALAWQKNGWVGFDTLFGIFKRFAPISYGIYALHYLFIFGSFFLFLPDWMRPWMGTVVSFAAAWFAEVPFQHFVNRWTSFLPNRTIRLSEKSS